jgi:hypothetical protein
MNQFISRILIVTASVALVAAVPGLSVAPSVKADAGSSAQIALDWNLNAVTAVRNAAPAKFQSEGLIYMSYVQAAVYDAVTKISGRYVPYHDFTANTAGASPEAALIAAAYNTLVAYLGDPDGSLAAKYAASIAALPDAGKAQGISVGQAASADIVALRAHDGRNAATAVYGAIGPIVAGAYQVVPPSTTAQTPWVAFMQPFLLKSPDQFRPDPPPSLMSAQWARDFNETKLYGAIDSKVRTPEQTATAYFWNANVINQDNQVFRDYAAQRGMDLVDAVRLLTMGELVETDTAIACFDAKYNYLFWRPYTAIRGAALTGNPDVVADPNWLPLLATPNHPEYPAAHGCLTGAMSALLSSVAGSGQINADIWGATNGGTTLTVKRHFDSVDALQAEIVNARVWIGFHFRQSAVEGVVLGRKVAHWAMKRYFRPLTDTPSIVAQPAVSPVSGMRGATTASFTVNFSSDRAGQGQVYFGSGPGCRGLVEVATNDLNSGGTEHTVVVTGNDLPGTVGDNGILPGATYSFEVVTITGRGVETDDNGGLCYSVTIPRQ